jgi:hypothetical protein
MTPLPNRLRPLLQELASVRRFPDSIFGQGCSTKGTPGDLSTEFFLLFREWPWGRRIRSTAFSVESLPGAGTPASGLPRLVQSPKSMAP